MIVPSTLQLEEIMQDKQRNQRLDIDCSVCSGLCVHDLIDYLTIKTTSYDILSKTHA
jgi:hypothetical protein